MLRGIERAVERVAAERERRVELAQQRHAAMCALYSWDRAANATVDVYRRIMQRPAPTAYSVLKRVWRLGPFMGKFATVAVSVRPSRARVLRLAPLAC